MESLYWENNQLKGSNVTKKQEINSVFAIFRTICAYAIWWQTEKSKQMLGQNKAKWKTLNNHFSTYNQFHNTLSLFDDLPNFPFTSSETMGDHYLKTWYMRVASAVAERLKT